MKQPLPPSPAPAFLLGFVAFVSFVLAASFSVFLALL